MVRDVELCFRQAALSPHLYESAVTLRVRSEHAHSQKHEEDEDEAAGDGDGDDSGLEPEVTVVVLALPVPGVDDAALPAGSCVTHNSKVR